ncbi:FUSC family protein [Streptomyces sp. RLB3-6]|uniref:FUSC family protein n=1 Tax=Streptomyces sp. RLB3-6 TaxID=2594457 RepID=UPI0011654CD0|nr:FUSC family protein [Streptomyces sp. RLB3-6]QDN93457.1 FUSC family protein [Streptomyces sp. RLB3-6]
MADWAESSGKTRRLLKIYLSREGNGRYSWRLGIGAALAIGAPLTIGICLNRTAAGAVAAIAAWLAYLTVPSGDTRSRAGTLASAASCNSVAGMIGVLTASRPDLTAIAMALLALLVPLSAVGTIPLICLVLGTDQGHGVDPVMHYWLFLLGPVWAAVLLFIPFFGGPHAPNTARAPRRSIKAWLSSNATSLRVSAMQGTPQFRFALRLAVCFVLAFCVLRLFAPAHADWALIGIVTTMRPSWRLTTRRVIKRMGGQILGAAMAAALLASLQASPEVIVIIVIALCGTLARPTRSVNYGFWPVFDVPAMLLLLSLQSPMSWVDALERVGNNAAGALIAIGATAVLWPDREERKIIERFAALLASCADCLDDMTTCTEVGLASPTARTRRALTLAAAIADLELARQRLSEQRVYHTDLPTVIEAATEEAKRLCSLIDLDGERDTAIPRCQCLRALSGLLREVGNEDELTRAPLAQLCQQADEQAVRCVQIDWHGATHDSVVSLLHHTSRATQISRDTRRSSRMIRARA